MCIMGYWDSLLRDSGWPEFTRRQDGLPIQPERTERPKKRSGGKKDDTRANVS